MGVTNPAATFEVVPVSPGSTTRNGTLRAQHCQATAVPASPPPTINTGSELELAGDMAFAARHSGPAATLSIYMPMI
jgi:hypothetical protein